MIDDRAALLFDGWDEAMIWSCLQGYMGTMLVDDEASPKSAVIEIGDFCFFAGKPNVHMLDSFTGGKLLIPKDNHWETRIEEFFGDRVRKFFRYAIKKEPHVFDRDKLNACVAGLDGNYEIRLFDREVFELARKESWSVDLCSQFKDYADYERRAVGVAILHGGVLAAGASPYAVYHKGIEIEIDTKPEYRRKGLAAACGAKLILECLEREIYPSWDAHDLRSVALAEKLGYHLSHPYAAFTFE